MKVKVIKMLKKRKVKYRLRMKKLIRNKKLIPLKFIEKLNRKN